MLLETKKEWKCYICIDNFDDDILPSFQCSRCQDGKICHSCFYTPHFEMKECGVCRQPNIIPYSNQNINNINNINGNNNNNNNINNVITHSISFLSSFILFLLDYLICIISLELKNLKCSNLQHLMFPLVFMAKLFCVWFMNYLYLYFFRRLIVMHYIRLLEHIFGFYTFWFVYVYNNNISCIYFKNYILYYIFFIGITLPINFIIGSLSRYFLVS